MCAWKENTQIFVKETKKSRILYAAVAFVMLIHTEFKTSIMKVKH